MEHEPSRAGRESHSPRSGSGTSPTAPPDDTETPPGGASRVLKVFGCVLAVALVVAFGVGLAMTARVGVVPIYWFAGGAILAAAIVLAIAIGLWRTKPAQQPYRFTLLTGATVLGLAASLLVANFFGDFSDFLDNVQPTPAGTVPYDVIALTAHADGIESIAGEDVAQLGTDPNKAIVTAELGKLVTADLVDLAEPGLLADTLLNGTVAAAVIDRAYVSLLEDNNPDFANDTKVLYTLDITPAEPSAQPSPSALPPPPPPNGAFLAYISGIDQFGDVGAKGRSDVNILMAVNPTTGQILLVNTPRDFYVQLHGTTGLKDKLTHAGVYGVDMSEATLEDLYGVTVDYYLRINFTSVIEIVDLVGGIDVYSPNAFTSRYGNYNFIEGWNHMNGDQTLGFSRERYSFEAGDRTRGENQEAVIAALIKKLTEPSVLLHYNSIMAATQGAIQTNMPPDTIASLANQQLSKGTSWEISSMSANGSDASEPTYSYGSQELYVMVPDMSTVNAGTEKIKEVLAG